MYDVNKENYNCNLFLKDFDYKMLDWLGVKLSFNNYMYMLPKGSS